MTYLVFGWSRNQGGPADEFLGTVQEIDTSIEMDYEVYSDKECDAITRFGYAHEEREIEMVENLLGGRPRQMTTLVAWGAEGRENARPILAYLKVVPKT